MVAWHSKPHSGLEWVVNGSRKQQAPATHAQTRANEQVLSHLVIPFCSGSFARAI
jgi:hypothetical protein